jgi:hypothetical protein
VAGKLLSHPVDHGWWRERDATFDTMERLRFSKYRSALCCSSQEQPGHQLDGAFRAFFSTKSALMTLEFLKDKAGRAAT